MLPDAVPKDMAEAPTTVENPHRCRRWANWRIGIVGHLGISFAAVGILAALANIIVEQGVSIIEITRVTSVPAPVPIAVAIPVEHPRSEPPPLPSLDVKRSDLVDAVDQYGQAVVVRTQIANAENDARVPAAQRNLLSQQGNLSEVSADMRRTLQLALDSYRERGANLISVADQRRQTVERYADHLRSLNGLLDQAVDKSWKIFGRVVARQTVLKLRADHDQLQIAFSALGAADVFDPARRLVADTKRRNVRQDTHRK